MHPVSARLADGREIIYFDESDEGPRCLVDSRELPLRPTAPEMRYDRAAEEWVSVATHRQDRTHLPADDACPLCPSTGGRFTEIPSPDYDVVVFENRFPAYAGTAGGRCEVVCFTPEHQASFSGLTAARVATVMAAWIDRTLALSALAGVAQVFCFENRGRETGVTLSHPHGQVFGYPFVTPRTERMLAAARRHDARRGTNLFADLLATEVAAGERVVARGEHWTAFVPYAARWPLEVHLYPNRQVDALPSLSASEQAEFGTFYLDLLRAVEGVHGADVPYVSAWHQAPVGADDGLAYLHLELSSVRRAPGKVKYLAGSETAMGAFINDVAPEAAAQALREAFSHP